VYLGSCHGDEGYKDFNIDILYIQYNIHLTYYYIYVILCTKFGFGDGGLRLVLFALCDGSKIWHISDPIT